VVVSTFSLRKTLFCLSPREATFERRGFHARDLPAQQRLEEVGLSFLDGYNAAVAAKSLDRLAQRLQQVDVERRGFAFEGAAMGLTLLDRFPPWRKNRWRELLEGAGQAHIYMLHVGAGWALARLPWAATRVLSGFDPLLRWLAIDGVGFHAGYFRWPRYVREHEAASHFKGYAGRVFDQGLGRSLWFIEGADESRIPQTISTFPVSRQADLWSGIGLACSYAGPADLASLEALWKAAGPYQPQVAQGAAFAAQARRRAANSTAQTEVACRVLCGMSAADAAQLTDTALLDLPGDGEIPAYEVWRQRIQHTFSRERVTP